MDFSSKEVVSQQPGLEPVSHSQLIAVEANGPQHQYLDPTQLSYPAVAASLPPKKRICGLAKPTFWLAVGLAVLAAVVVGLGVGLGVALGNAQKANASAPTTAPTSPAAVPSPQPSSAPTSTEPTTTTSSSPTSSLSSKSSAAPSPSNICPHANNTILSPSLGKIRYRVACDSDFNGQDTLSSFVTEAWDDCLALCNTMNYFQQRADVGCTWNVAGTGTQTPGTCWCLGGAEKSVVENKGNVIAIPL